MADDLAEKAAEEATEEARGLTESPPLSYSEFKNLIKDSSLKKWQTYWTNNSSSLNVKELHPKVPTKRYISVTNKSAETKHMKIVSGHNKLQIHRHNLGFQKLAHANVDIQYTGFYLRKKVAGSTLKIEGSIFGANPRMRGPKARGESPRGWCPPLGGGG